jgi:hypothetical protein
MHDGMKRLLERSVGRGFGAERHPTAISNLGRDALRAFSDLGSGQRRAGLQYVRSVILAKILGDISRGELCNALYEKREGVEPPKDANEREFRTFTPGLLPLWTRR